MKNLTWRRIGIGLFCSVLMGTGILTIGTNTKVITKEVISEMKSGYAKEGMDGVVEGAINGVTSSVNNNLVWKNSFINLYGLVERVLGKNYIKDSDITYDVIKDNNGQLQFITFQKDLTGPAESIVALNKTLEEKSIPFVYVQTPLKVIEGFTEMPKTVVDYANTNTNNFVAQLEEGGVDVLDLRDRVEEEALDKQTLFYNTDHHWRTETAFWGVQKLVEYLKAVYGMTLDPEGMYTDSNQYRRIFYEQSFLGSQGRRVGKYFAGVDDFTLMLPQFATDYSVTINKSDSSTTTTGNFEETIIKKYLLEDPSVFTNRYATYFGGDYPEVIVKNNSVESDKKILIVKDSFALPFSAFLSTMVEETRILDLRYYSQMSVEEYVAAYKPDLVLYVYKSINTQK